MSQPNATATLMISKDPGAPMRTRPDYHESLGISREAYEEFPAVFTLTELPEPAVVAAACIKNYAETLRSIPENERGAYDLDVDDRWNDVVAVRRFIDRALESAFGGKHFTMVEGRGHLVIGRLYLDNPLHTLSVADADGEIIDFYSAPEGFEQPISIEARIQVLHQALPA